MSIGSGSNGFGVASLPGVRVAVVGGARTPFVKAGTVFKNHSMQKLGTHVLSALVDRAKLDTNKIDEFIFGAVLLDPRTPNWAREILFTAGLPKTIYAHSVSNNCISGLIAVTSVAERIALGRIGCGIAGGSESMSNPPMLFNPRATKKFLSLAGAKTFSAKLTGIAAFRPGDFLPSPPGVTEPSTGLTMGEHMEITAKEFSISRESQDIIAYSSHVNAAKATSDGLFKDAIVPLDGIDKDLMIRPDTSLEKLKKLPPVFDRKSGKGTITAGNSSPLTDGASVVLLMSEGEAKLQGRQPLAWITDYEYAAIAPSDGLLMAPAVAVPKMLSRNNLKLEDFDLIEIHEAFGAQVEANIHAWENGWKEQSIGNIDREKLNTLGGSIAIGHPFAATGGRIVHAVAAELKRRSLRRALISVCAAGAMAGAMILERE